MNQSQRRPEASPPGPDHFFPGVRDDEIEPAFVVSDDNPFPGLRVGPHAELDLDPVGVEKVVRSSVDGVIRSADHFFTARAENPAT
jgi:hypothetical protein